MIYILKLSSGISSKKSKQTTIIQLTKINKSECQLSFTTRFHDSIETNKFNDSERIKNLLISDAFIKFKFFHVFYNKIN